MQIHQQIHELYEFNCRILQKVVNDLKKFPILVANRRFKGLTHTIEKGITKANTQLKKNNPPDLAIYENTFFDAYTLIYGKYLDIELLNYFAGAKKIFKKFNSQEEVDCLGATWFQINFLQWGGYQLANKIDYETLADFRPLLRASIAALASNMNNSFVLIEMENDPTIIENPNFQKLIKTIEKMKLILSTRLQETSFNQLLQLGKTLTPNKTLHEIAQLGDSPAFYCFIINYDLKTFEPIIRLVFRLIHQKP